MNVQYPLDLWSSFLSGEYWQYTLPIAYKPTVFWSEFTAEFECLSLSLSDCLSFSASYALLINEVNELSHQISESTQFKVVEGYAHVEQHVGSYLLRC